MTTIVYRNGIMAADSRAYAGNKMPIGFKEKIKRLPDGTLIGVSSHVPGLSEVVRDWYIDGAKPGQMIDVKHSDQGFTLLAVKPNGQAFIARNAECISGPLEAEFWAVGSGEEPALGALYMGADAETAVRIAALVDRWTDGPIMTLRHA